jgi:hypothetical protein
MFAEIEYFFFKLTYPFKMSFDFKKLSKRLTEEMKNLRKQTVIQEIFKLIPHKYVNLHVFGGALRDWVAGERANDRDVWVVGDSYYLAEIKRTITRKFRRHIKRSGDYFGAGNLSMDVIEIQSSDGYYDSKDVFWYDIDLVFVEEISDEVLDFDINGMSLMIDDRPEYTWKDIHLSSGTSNQKLKQMFRNIVDKRCFPTSYILRESNTGNETKDAVNQLYRFTKMLTKGYKIQHDNWEQFVVRQYNLLTDAVKWNEEYLKATGKASEADREKHRTVEYSFQRIRTIEYRLKDFCLKHIMDISIAFIPLGIPVYVQLWILEFEMPICLCIKEFDRVKCLEKIHERRKKVIEWRNRDPKLSYVSLSSYKYYRDRENNDDDEDSY